jgi:hypothetical protein
VGSEFGVDRPAQIERTDSETCGLFEQLAHEAARLLLARMAARFK